MFLHCHRDKRDNDEVGMDAHFFVRVLERLIDSSTGCCCWLEAPPPGLSLFGKLHRNKRKYCAWSDETAAWQVNTTWGTPLYLTP